MRALMRTPPLPKHTRALGAEVRIEREGRRGLALPSLSKEDDNDAQDHSTQCISEWNRVTHVYGVGRRRVLSLAGRACADSLLGEAIHVGTLADVLSDH